MTTPRSTARSTAHPAALALAWGLGLRLGLRLCFRLCFRLCLLAGAGAALHTAPVAHAQDLPAPGEGFAWERVGDRHIQPYGLAFGPDATLWATGNRGPYRLDTSAGFPGTWVHVHDSGIISGP
ncbi:MAG: hypothetical protein R3181_02260, partial [Rubricoccaceae bacterium]|nr:hypothetical protein [Rubricoccaceae bacterium]